MSNDDEKDAPRKTIDPPVTKSVRKALAGGYEVGYGKPPVETRFKKGTSGNPAGRPRRRKPQQELAELSAAPVPASTVMREELLREIVAQEAGGTKTMPLLQAALRNLVKLAFNGSVNANKEVVRLAAEEARKQEAEIAEDRAYWRDYVDRFDTMTRSMEAVGNEVPDWMPRPEDITFPPGQMTVIRGPASPEEMVHYISFAEIWEQFIAKGRYDCAVFPPRPRGTVIQPHDHPFCIFFPYLLDKIMPKRMQLTPEVIQERFMSALFTSHQRLEEELIQAYDGVEGDECDDTLLSKQGPAIGHGIYNMAAELGVDLMQLQAKQKKRPKRYRKTGKSA